MQLICQRAAYFRGNFSPPKTCLHVEDTLHVLKFFPKNQSQARKKSSVFSQQKWPFHCLKKGLNRRKEMQKNMVSYISSFPSYYIEFRWHFCSWFLFSSGLLPPPLSLVTLSMFAYHLESSTISIAFLLAPNPTLTSLFHSLMLALLVIINLKFENQKVFLVLISRTLLLLHKILLVMFKRTTLMIDLLNKILGQNNNNLRKSTEFNQSASTEWSNEC